MANISENHATSFPTSPPLSFRSPPSSPAPPPAPRRSPGAGPQAALQNSPRRSSAGRRRLAAAWPGGGRPSPWLGASGVASGVDCIFLQEIAAGYGNIKQGFFHHSCYNPICSRGITWNMWNIMVKGKARLLALNDLRKWIGPPSQLRVNGPCGRKHGHMGNNQIDKNEDGWNSRPKDLISRKKVNGIDDFAFAPNKHLPQTKSKKSTHRFNPWKRTIHSPKTPGLQNHSCDNWCSKGYGRYGSKLSWTPKMDD